MFRLKLVVLACLTLVASLVGPATPAHASVFVGDTPDPSWRVDGAVYATVIVGDTVVVGGQFSNAVSSTGATVPRKNLAAFSMETGSLLTHWRADATAIVRGLASDGSSVYVGGVFPVIGGVSQPRLAKLDATTGVVDPSFAPVVNDTVRALAIDGSELFVGGSFTAVNGTARSRVAKVDGASGALATGFNAPASHTVYGFALDSATRTLYVAGNFTTLAGASRSGVGAVNADTGAIRPTVFASTARPSFGLSLDEDGSRLFGAGGGGTNAVAAWDTSNGVRLWRQVANGDIQAVTYYGGEVYFGFHDGFQGDLTLKLLAADATTGALDQEFRPRFDDFWGVWALDVTDEGLIAAGDFTTVSGVPASGFARFKRSGSLPPPPPESFQYVTSATPWRYWDQGTRPSGWESPGFDDSGWATGLTQLGYGDGDESTVLGYGPSASAKYLASYLRTTFEVSTVPDSVSLLLAADDGAVVYVNGVEAVRDNMPAGTVTNTTRAASGRAGGAENELRPFALDPALFTAGENTVAVEVHQDSQSSSDLTFDADLTGKVSPPPNVPPVASFSADVDALEVAFDASASSDTEGPVTSYHWNFGDGVTATGPAVAHTYASPGDYTVTLRVGDSGGAHDTTVRTVTALSPTVVDDVVASGASWSHRYLPTAPEPTWAQPAYDASGWSTGNAVLGFGTTVATDINAYPTTAQRPLTAYFRRSFTVPDRQQAQGLRLTAVANDGVVIYVNGVEVARANMPAGAIGFGTYASSARSAATANAAPVVVEVPLDLLVEGVNVVAAETHLNYRGTADATFDLRATLTSAR